MRIIAKNLPTDSTQQSIREYFSAKGTPTDVRLLTTISGESRGVAFIGYKTEEEADASIIHYNRSYYNGCRIKVEKNSHEHKNRNSTAKTRTKTDGSGMEIDEMKEILKKIMVRSKDEIWSSNVDIEEEGTKKHKKNENDSLESIIEKYKEDADSKRKNKVLETGEVFVHGIPYTATEEEVEKAFEQYGMIAEVFMKYKEREDAWGEGKALNTGYAIITFTFPKDAYALIGKTVIFQGRNTTVLPSKGRPQEEVTDKNRSNVSHGKYNPVFFNFTAVLGVAAKEKRVSKRDILKDRGIGVGGKIALLESELIERTRKFLSDEGIAEECTCSKTPCTCMFISKKSILIKNIPYETKEGEIKQHFKKYIRAVFSPSKTLVVLEYSNKSDAQTELKNNNFSKIRDQPIYIEYLKVTKERYTREISGLPPTVDEAPAEKEEKEKTEEPQVMKIILKNIPFQAGRSELSELLTGLIGKEYVLRIPKKADGTHRGFCFVELSNNDQTQTILQKLKHVHLYGRHIIAQKAEL
ncbi:multiple RNA-binding domain-containing protein 1 [Nematocida minor]|uniref:multiple RNA-binding domain-containing protein 1 n=1 Tax=Nematocida minor TaxID=1912983 RepID=UPI0022211046|nr:multiple RNA-binding domain-containing protein 1 [Nematocida minor]KAI5192740.1 multiple RNA-binding domain-containing protein 1 [Nematocida minor]